MAEDDPLALKERQACVDCGALSPKTETNYTLISQQYGWRLTRTRNAQNQPVLEWRCPKCWKAYRSSRSPR